MSATSVQRSIRLSAQTSDALDAAAERGNESRNALVERLLTDGLRIERHPLIRFRTGAAGRREPALVGTRLLVRQVIATLLAEGDGIDGAAETLVIPSRFVRAARAYYAEFKDEVDNDVAWANRIADVERAAWEREQAVLV